MKPSRLLVACAALLLAAGAAAAQDVRVNDRSGDPAGTMQFSPSVAALGDTVLVCWSERGNGGVVGLKLAMSYDGGANFTPVPLPALSSGWSWSIEGKVVVEPGGAFFLAGRARSTSFPLTGAWGAVFAVRGHPAAGVTMNWFQPGLVDLLTSSPNIIAIDGELLDLAIYPVDDRVMVAWNSFGSGATPQDDSLRFAWSYDAAFFSNPVTVFTQTGKYLVHPRLKTSLDGTTTLAWVEGTDDRSSFALRSRRAANLVNWQPLETIAIAPGYASNAPARAWLAHPGLELAADPVYHEGFPSTVALWSAGFDAYGAPLPPLGPFTRRGSFDVGDTTSTADFFLAGEALEGDFSSGTDVDFWRFSAIAGTRYVFVADSGASVSPPSAFLAMEMSVVGPDGRSWIAGQFGGAQENVQSTVVGFVAPVDGFYWLRVSTPYGVGTGGYRIRSAIDTRPPALGRDQGDVFLTGWSVDDVAWSSTPSAASAPFAPGYHESCPSLAYGEDGWLWVAWYDWEQTPASATSRFRVSRYQGDLQYHDTAIVSSAPCDWMSVVSARQYYVLGRTTALARSRDRMYLAWTDGREGDSDIRLRRVLTGMRVTACGGTIVAHPGETVHVPATVQNDNDLFANGFASSNGSQRYWPGSFPQATPFTVPASSSQVSDLAVAIPDTAAIGAMWFSRQFTNGESCVWTISIESNTGVGDAEVAFGLEAVSPNPVAGTARLAWALPRAERATLEILDPAGRRVRTIASGGFGAGRHEHSWDGRDASGHAVDAGVYWARLRAASGTLTRRFVRLK